jgi:nitrite reductase/ring-hydroxylating ferredoxin subunit
LTQDGQKIVCASHGAIYEIDSGICVAGPCLGRKLRAVSVDIVEGNIVVTGPSSQA